MITVAIIGAGIGREHLDGYRALPDSFRVKTLCDLDISRAKEIIGNDPIAMTADLSDALQDPDIDLIDVCLPPHLHFDVATKAVRLGKHVICEKPLVTSLAQADALIATAAEYQRKFYPVFQYRYGTAMAQLTALSNAGLIGKPHAASLETHWNRGSDYYAVPWRGTWAGENGGAVLGHAIHNHDLVTKLMGRVIRLSAFTDTRINPIETEDSAAITMQTETGALLSSSITLGASEDTTRLRLVYEKLTATSGKAPYAPAMDNWTFTARNPDDQARIDAVVSSIGEVKSGFVGFMSAIADDLAGKPADVVTPEDGRRSLELVAAIYDAARSGTVVDLPLGAEHPFYQGWHPNSAVRAKGKVS